MVEALIVGYGSIGRRHAEVLTELGCRVAAVSHHAEDMLCYDSLDAALESSRADYVVIANETTQHRASLERLAHLGYDGSLLIEKPLFDRTAALPALPFRRAAVAYNLRFHPLLRELRRRLAHHRVLTIQVYAGQYLPDWRPGRDYRDSYSASVARGGGVLRDLSHEIDYIAWLFGPWRRLTAVGGASGALGIESDDGWSVLMELESGAAVGLQLNYFDRPGRREIVVNLADGTLHADLGDGRLSENGEVRTFGCDRNLSYREQHRALLEGRTEEACSLEEGLAVLETIAAIETAAQERCWVKR